MTLKDIDTADGTPTLIGRKVPVGPHPAMRPRDAASLILIDRSGPAFRVLVGKRAGRHVFMPNAYVFPGGRRDRADSFAAIRTDLHESVAERLMKRVPARTSPVRARALAVAALRETFEETGLRVGSHDATRDGCDLSLLRYVARAITPPGRSRRYDTRFFAAFTDEARIAPDDVADSAELGDLQWIALDVTPDLPLPGITATILAHVRDEMGRDANLPHGRPVPFHYSRRGLFTSELL